MSNNFWQYARFGDLVLEKPRNGLYKSASYQGMGNRWIKMKDLYGNMVIANQVMDRIVVTKDEEIKFSCDPGDLLFGRTSVVLEGVGTCSIIGDIDDKPIFESNLFRVRLNQTRAYPSFYLYYFRSPLGRSQISTIARQTAAAQITSADLINLEVPAPSLPDQQAIAHILGTLDNKIELNQQMNRNLEAIAQAIFKSWFVDFDPVRSKVEGRQPAGMNAVTAALFPDSLEDSQLGAIPKGWSVVRLADICSTQYGYTASAKNEKVGSHLLRVMDINKRNWIEWADVPYCEISEADLAKYSLKVGDIVVARMADPGKSAIVEQEVDAVFASYLVRLKTESLSLAYYVYHFLKSSIYKNYTASAQSGSVQANMNAKVIAAVDLVLPPNNLLYTFLDQILPIRKKIVINVEQSRSLATIRDTLLPKLMSGEVRVKEAEEILEDVA